MNPEVERRVDQIKGDREHGAGWLSREAVATLKLAAGRSEATSRGDFLKDLEATAQRLIEARPSMIAVTNLVTRFIHRLSQNSEENLDLLKGFAGAMGDQLIRDSEEATLKAARLASGMIDDGDTVMSCSYSSTICQALEIARDWGKRIYVMVAESRTGDGRAYGQIAARKLSSLGLPAEIVPDSSIEHNVTRVTKVMVGADTILHDGSLVNGTPTGAVALAARKAKIPFYTVCEASKLDLWHSPSRQAQLEAGFDRVAADLITGIVTEAGIMTPGKLRRHVAKWAKSI